MKGIAIGSRLVQAGFLAALLLLWYGATTAGHVSDLLLPNPLDVAAQIGRFVAGGAVLAPLAITLREVFFAFLLAAAAGLPCGYFISRSRYWVAVFDPLLIGINAVPAILFFPLFTLLFGLGSGSKIALGVTIGFFPITLNTMAGFANTAEVYLKAARSMGAADRHLIRFVLLPSALPVVLVGLRIGLILCFLAVLGGETIASFGGLGHQIADASQSMDAVSMYAWIVIVIAIAALLNLALSWLGPREAPR